MLFNLRGNLIGVTNQEIKTQRNLRGRRALNYPVCLQIIQTSIVRKDYAGLAGVAHERVQGQVRVWVVAD